MTGCRQTERYSEGLPCQLAFGLLPSDFQMLCENTTELTRI